MTSLVKVNFILMIPEKINYKTEKYGRIEIKFEHYKSN